MCNPGVQYTYDPSLFRYTCSGTSLSPVFLSTVNSGQILTLRSGQSAWLNTSDVNQLGPSGLVWTLESGANLYSYNLGLNPFQINFVSGSGLPSGLTLSSYNKITGTPTQTGVFQCATRYVYCTGVPVTGIAKRFTLIVCTGTDTIPLFTPNFLPKVGVEFYYDNAEFSPPCATGISANAKIVSVLTGQKLTLESGVPAWRYLGPTYEFLTGNQFFSLENNKNLYTNASGFMPFSFTSSPLPPNLTLSEFNLIEGTPIVTGTWSIDILQRYCSGGPSVYTRNARIILSVSGPQNLRNTDGILYGSYSAANTLPYLERKVKNLDFYYKQNNRFNKYFDTVTGYGNTNLNIGGQNLLIYDTILNPTGWRDAVIYQTGRLTGIIAENATSFTWFDEKIDVQSPFGQVYINQVTGTIQAQNIIYFNTGLLTEGDNLNINGYDFIYSTSANSDNFIFNSPSQLVSNLNSGALDPNSLLNFVGVTGFVNNNNIHLYSSLLSGEDGNSIKVYRNSNILEAIVIPNRYFVSGQTLRLTTNLWRGDFTRTLTVTAENSGIYTYTLVNPERFQGISGVVWVDNFSGTYFITTGVKNPDTITTYSGVLLNYIPSKNIYSGSGVIPSGQNRIPSGFNIDILKLNPYNISGNFARYRISGSDFLFTGIIEG